MIPFAHPKDFEFFENGLENFWSPKEIPMGHDKQQWETCLTDGQKDTIRMNLSNLTTADVEIMDNVHDGIGAALRRAGLTEAPETRMMLNLQAMQESLHTYSYQHILESLGMDRDAQARFYTMWEREPAMRDKVQHALDVTKQLAEGNYPDLATLAALLAFYWLLYEGGWFWSGFSINWAMTNAYRDGIGKPYLYGTSEQLIYIARDESQHINFGIEVIKRVLNKGNGFNLHLFNQLAHEVVELEAAYANRVIGEPILGYTAVQHVEFLQYVINIRYTKLGFNPPFPKVKTNPAPWRDTFESKQEKNFFETRVTDYRIGANLGWDDANGGMNPESVIDSGDENT